MIIRDRAGNGFLLPSYAFFFNKSESPSIVALKQGGNRTTNYHLFDMTRGVLTRHLSKKSGNYLGKLRSNYQQTETVLYTNNKEKIEAGAFRFDRPGLFDQLKDGSQPRKLHIILPQLDDEGKCKYVSTGGRNKGDIDSEIYNRFTSSPGDFHQLQTKEPVFENGNYRLNFHGRVTIPSVKNYQLTSPEDISNVVCQFGKVGDDRFHLDFKTPLNAVQAFAIALTQFSL